MNGFKKQIFFIFKVHLPVDHFPLIQKNLTKCFLPSVVGTPKTCPQEFRPLILF